MKLLFVGIGRIGLPISLVASDKKNIVYAYDNNFKTISNLKSKRIPFYEKGMKKLLINNIGKNFLPIHSLDEVKIKIDIIFITIGTEVPKYPKNFSLNSFYKSIDKLINKFGLDVIYCLRTTVPIGTCDKIIKKYNKINLAFVPERLIEGDAISEEKKLPKIIGSNNLKTKKTLTNFFHKIGGKIIETTTLKTAEFCKLVDNSYRSTIFAFANDLALTADKNEVDIYEVINSINDGYKRNSIPFPGFVSGYCLSKDPYIFEYAYDYKNNKKHSTWFHARKSNDFLNQFLIDKIIKNKFKKILFLGISFKQDIDDFRLSHVIDITTKLQKLDNKININLYDPNINSNDYTDLKKFININKKIYFSDNLKDNILFYEIDLVVISHKHKQIKSISKNILNKKIIGRNIKIYDFWNIWSFLQKKYKNYYSFGRGTN
tara:strand:+ start:8562 stop:9857 length:1296 start_codon:yes stop_codon:yes gene_type:complete